MISGQIKTEAILKRLTVTPAVADRRHPRLNPLNTPKTASLVVHIACATSLVTENPLDASDDPFPLLALTAGAVGSEPRTLSQALSGNDAGKSSQDLKTSPSSPIATSSRSSWDRMGKSTTKPSPLLPKSPRFVSYSPTPHSSTGRLIRSMSLALTSMQKSTKRSIWSPLQVS